MIATGAKVGLIDQQEVEDGVTRRKNRRTTTIAMIAMTTTTTTNPTTEMIPRIRPLVMSPPLTMTAGTADAEDAQEETVGK